jgi:hypothetical protein
MKEIRNKTGQPIRVPLPGGKTLFLGPGKQAQVADKALELGSMKKLVEAGSIEILIDGERVDGITNTTGTPGLKQDAAKSPFRRKSGDR